MIDFEEDFSCLMGRYLFGQNHLTLVWLAEEEENRREDSEVTVPETLVQGILDAVLASEREQEGSGYHSPKESQVRKRRSNNSVTTAAKAATAVLHRRRARRRRGSKLGMLRRRRRPRPE